MFRKNVVRWAFGLLGVGIAASQASAGYTSINSPGGTELNFNQIINGIYDSTFTQTGLNYTDGNTFLTRIMDTPDSGPVLQQQTALNVTPANTALPGSHPTNGTVDSTDQLWSANSVHATAEARYALYDQHFGYFNGSSGGSYHEIFNLRGSGFNVTGEGDLSNVGNTIWRWARYGTNGGLVTSQNSDNPDKTDHLITYRIDNVEELDSVSPRLTTQTVSYLLFFEDRLPGDNVDYDYNDLVVQIDTQQPFVAPIISASPLPEPAALSVIGVGGLLAMRRKSRV